MQLLLALLALAGSALALPNPNPEPKEPKPPKGGKKIPMTSIPKLDPKLSDVYQSLHNGTELETRDLTKRALGGLYVTRNINWGQPGYYGVYPWGACIVLDSYWNNALSSVGPDQGTRCSFYDDSACYEGNGGYITLTYPGAADLTQVVFVGQNWNDRISSFKCWW